MSGPAFTTIPRAAVVNIDEANTNRTDTGAIESVFAAGADGSKIERVAIRATAATTEGVVRLWLHNGVANFLLKEVLVPAITPGTDQEAFEAEVDFSAPDQALVLPTGWSFCASTHNAESFNVHALGGDYPAAA